MILFTITSTTYDGCLEGTTTTCQESFEDELKGHKYIVCKNLKDAVMHPVYETAEYAENIRIFTSNFEDLSDIKSDVAKFEEFLEKDKTYSDYKVACDEILNKMVVKINTMHDINVLKEINKYIVEEMGYTPYITTWTICKE